MYVLCIQAERAEKERLKRVVLDIHERQEEEDYQGERFGYAGCQRLSDNYPGTKVFLVL